MKTRWFWLPALLLALPAQAATVIKVAFPEHSPPWVNTGVRPGIAVELLREALQAEGLALHPVYYPVARRMAMFRRNEVDAIYDISPLAQKHANLPGTLGRPLHTFDNLAMALHKRKLKLDSTADLVGLNILAWDGAQNDMPDSFDRLEAVSQGHYNETGDQRQQVKSLYAGRVDVILADRLVLDWYRKHLRGEAGVDVRQPVDIFAILPPREATVLWRDPILRQRMDYRLREMKSDGRYNAIFRRYDAEPQP
ncbi:substrate-binding periplasmic protein [Vogesella mureinivorans]|uniref:substrate-binding periplasmic protein n=1 Tax=Vogesella mureinivorans TaxID=657276 RepID=UPI0011CB1E97|nr:transporter substrate-binding domain-containing protein [Vogesella mureinivorans]